jgi:hypothetical protein
VVGHIEGEDTAVVGHIEGEDTAVVSHIEEDTAAVGHIEKGTALVGRILEPHRSWVGCSDQTEVVVSEGRPLGLLVQADLEDLDLGQMDLESHLVVGGRRRWKEMAKEKHEQLQMMPRQGH